MELTVVSGLRSEIFVPVIPPVVFTPVTRPVKELTVALVTGAGVYRKTDPPFRLSGDSSFRLIPDGTPEEDLAVSHGGYDNRDVNRDINAMLPLRALHQLGQAGLVHVSPVHVGFMGGGGDLKKLTEETAPAIVSVLREAGANAVVLTAG